MKKKLPFVVTNFLLTPKRDFKEGRSIPQKRMFLQGNLLLTLLLMLFLLFSSKSNAQLSESFDGGVPTEWSVFGSGSATINWSTTTDGNAGTNAVSINPSADNIGDQNTATYFLVTPQISVPENGEIQFYTKQGDDIDHGTEFQIKLSTALQPDADGFNITLQSYTETNLNIASQTTYEKKVVVIPESIPAGLDIYIAFVAVNTQEGATATGDEWFIDDVSVLEGCAEIIDEDVVIENITVNSADISWSHPTATDFEIQIIPEGGTPAESGISITGNSYALSSLEGETSYDVYLSALCGNATQSDWTGPYSFTTPILGVSCDSPIIVPDVLAEGAFTLTDNLANYYNPDVQYTTAGTSCISNAGTTNYLNGDKAFLSYTATEDALITITQTTAGYDPSNPLGNCFNSNTSILVYQSCEDVGVTCLAGTTTSSGNLQAQIQNLLVEAGETYIIVVSSDLAPEAGICFELEIEGSTCASPTGITYDDLTDTSVSLSWETVVGFGDSWEYSVVPTGSDEPTTVDATTSTNTDNIINTGLEAGLTYDFYARSICGGVPGEWSAPYTFTMQCAVFDTPYSADFETASDDEPEACWTVLDVNGDGETWSYSFGGVAMRINSYSANNINNNNDILVSPRINLDGVTQKRVRFNYNAYQGSAVVALKVSTTGVGADNFDTVILPATEFADLGWDNYEELIVNIPIEITGEVNIAWVIEPNAIETANSFTIEDVFIEDKPACPDPLAPTVENITATSADLYWNQGDIETQWQVVIQDENSGIPVDDSVAILTSTNDPYLATDLDPATRYEYYVRAYCNDEEQSEWVGPTLFITECATFDIPFFESFDDSDADTQKFCWSFLNENADAAEWLMNENEPSIQGSTSWFNPTTGYDDWIISPAIVTEGGTYELKFDYRAQYSFFYPNTRFGLEVLISTTDTDPASFSPIVPLFDFVNTEYQEKSIYFEATGTIFIAFRVPPEFSLEDGSSILNIDNVNIVEAQSCPTPSGIEVSAITGSTAEMTWQAGFQEEAWNVVIQPEGSGEPTDATGNSTTTSYSFTDLVPATTYEVYVQANCDTENSMWFGPVNFTTLCNAFESPFIETFEEDSASRDCWRIVDGNQNNDTWFTNISMSPYEGDLSASIFSGYNGDNDDWLISPLITITENQRLRYYYKVNDSFFAEDLRVLLSTNGIELDQFTTVLYDTETDPVLINNVEYKEMIIDLPEGITGDINIAFHIPYYEPSPAGYRGQLLFVDNVIIEDVPSCPEASNVTVTNVTDVQAEVNWDVSGTAATEWEIAVLPYDMEAPTGTVDEAYLYQTATPPFTITDLIAASKYNVYVRAICGETETTAWSNAVEFTTKCSYENLCAYTVILTSDNSYGVGGGIDIIQNEIVQQTLEFPSGSFGQIPEPLEYQLLLCTGVEFSLFWDSIGTAPDQYPNAQVEVLDFEGNTVYTSPLGIGTPRTTLYTDVALCGVESCPQPTDLTASETSVLSWTAGGDETQWEVAIQPLDNGTIPQSGAIVDTNTYTPTDADFNDENAATYEYFVRAICNADDESYWSGPYSFVRNDDATTALTLPINETEYCNSAATNVTFRNTSVSSEDMTCNTVNEGDVWFEFTATSRVHYIEINGFTGNYYVSSGDELYPDITMTLYHELDNGDLDELTCSQNNTITASYASELVVGDSYKLRLSLQTPVISTRTFNVCVTTPEDLCQLNGLNGDFERPLMTFNAIQSILQQQIVPGWRTDLETWNAMFIWNSLVGLGFEAYSGSQCIQLLNDPDSDEIRGLYKDFDTSEITLYDYNFALGSRSDGNIVELYAGPPEGPFELVVEHAALASAWEVHSGSYEVPEGQPITRFLFKEKNNNIGTLLDDVNFIPNNSIDISSLDQEVDCQTASIDLVAEGVGTWEADATNPGEVIISDASANEITISGFTVSGTYTFTWSSRYCEDTIELTYNGISDMPTVETPVEYCLDATAEALTATPTDGYTLLWYTEALGGTGSATAITPETNTLGSTSYYVANVDENGCESPRSEIVVTINETVVPELTFSYLDACIITLDNPLPVLPTDFALGGTFTSTTLTVDELTGEIDMTTATVGDHEVLYTYDGDSETCALAGDNTATITFTSAIVPETNFDYGTASFCSLNESSIQPTLSDGFISGGTFSTATLAIDATTGVVDITDAAAGTHDITYTYEGDVDNCISSGTYTTTIEIDAINDTVSGFTYAYDLYCADSSSVFPELEPGFTTGGVFSAESGLTIGAATGEVNVASSSVGNYNITYEVLEDASNCITGSVSTFNFTVLGAIEAVIEGECNDEGYILTVSPLDESYNADEVTYTWTDFNGTIVGQNSEVFNVTEYADQNSDLTLPVEFTVTVEFGGCSTTTSFAAEQLDCRDIPRGISPDGNGKNDDFDLSGHGVTELFIFNRHGREVYNFKGTYTNQWSGQSNSGDELPDGTYFYTLRKSDGSKLTGWVFINRAH
ncbi:choice-of-anchor J domain-containing protein [Winogradskyella vidalii]|uniref:choice-of-anchor J domain-containing protein n=1 Tax=Winogradskyella vidalii TaxID=2615024 RepID=UPI0015C8A452|nr:choice-of-anchor J domain-containing protein [Winogradskyella vidalii]